VERYSRRSSNFPIEKWISSDELFAKANSGWKAVRDIPETEPDGGNVRPALEILNDYVFTSMRSIERSGVEMLVSRS
jgi:hypothetical protein